MNGEVVVKNAGFAYLFVLPLFHYMTYEYRNPDEYYFYHNLGISKMFLWIATIMQAIIVELIILFL